MGFIPYKSPSKLRLTWLKPDMTENLVYLWIKSGLALFYTRLFKLNLTDIGGTCLTAIDPKTEPFSVIKSEKVASKI